MGTLQDAPSSPSDHYRLAHTNVGSITLRTGDADKTKCRVSAFCASVYYTIFTHGTGIPCKISLVFHLVMYCFICLWSIVLTYLDQRKQHHR